MGSSSKAKDAGKLLQQLDSGKYARYTPEQVELLERVYTECPKPSSSRRQQLIRDCPILANIGQKQLKVWFQNRRCREKQRKETGRLQTCYSKLNAMNQILMEENERLHKQAAQLSLENQYLKQQLQLQHPQVDLNFRAIVPTNNDTSSESVVTSGHPQHSPQHVSQDYSHLSVVAEKILTDFLDKASGGMVEGIPLPGMKPGPDSIGALALPHSGGRVTAQACGSVNLGTLKIAEIIKNRPSWLQDCRKQDIIASFAADRGGLIELVHTQMYAPTPLASAYDFFTLRYTCLLENGNLVVCEGSLAAGQGFQEIVSLPGFIRAEMLPSGALIRSCEQNASVVMVIDDMNFKSCGVMEAPQPLYDTSTLLAWRVTHKVLCHLRGYATEKAEMGLANIPVQAFSLRLARGFNDAINCFPDDGWLSVINDGTISVHVNSPPNPPDNCKPFVPGMTMRRGILCAKASLLLHNVPPSVLVNFLRERLAAWADLNAEISLGHLSRVNLCENMLKRKATSVKVFPSVSGQTEVLEIVKLQKTQLPRPDETPEVESFLLQLCSSMEDISPSSYAQLIFAPIDASMPDDIPLLSSGFRVMHIDACNESITSSQTLDLASSLEDRSSTHRMQNKGLNEMGSALTIVFQYLFELENRNIMALKAQQNVQALVDLLRQVAISSYPRASPAITGSLCNMEPVTLVQQLADSFRVHVGQELLSCIDAAPEVLFKSFWNLRHAIVCCAWKPLPEFIFANLAALEMLESSLPALREMSLERMFNDGCRKTDYSQPPPFLQKEGYAHLPAGICLSSTGRPVSFERATGWKVVTGDPSVRIAAFMFYNWSFAGAQLQ